jgi:hypothetical protein
MDGVTLPEPSRYQFGSSKNSYDFKCLGPLGETTPPWMGPPVFFSSGYPLSSEPSPLQENPSFNWTRLGFFLGNTLAVAGGLGLALSTDEHNVQRALGVGLASSGVTGLLVEGIELFGEKDGPLWLKLSVTAGSGLVAGLAFGLGVTLDRSGGFEPDPGARFPVDEYGP